MNMKTDCVLVCLLSSIPKDTPDKQYPLWYSPPVKKEKYTEIKYIQCILKPQYLNIKNSSYED